MVPAAAPPSDSASAIPWNRILRDIHNRQVLPIIGPRLVTAEGQTFSDWLAPQLAARLGLPVQTAGTLNQTACAHLVNRGKRKDIYEELRELVELHAGLPVPPALMDLAAIRDFDLFITSTFDGFLAQALRKTRPGYDPDYQKRRGVLDFHPQRPVDLPDPLPSTFLYHVLGAWHTYPDFAVWEEDYMEFICGLLEAPKDTRRHLFRELGNRSLLLIGAPFDDWTVRFFLRVAKQQRLSDRRGSAEDYLADMPGHLGEPLIFYFDQVVGSPQILSADPVQFTAELRQRWEEKYGTVTNEDLLDSIPDDMERGSVFISYSRDDLEAALTLAAGLRSAGIPVWLDKRRLQPGGNWEQALKRAVKSRAALFLSLVSAATESNANRFVHEERRWAAEVHVPGEIFYIPILLDPAVRPRLEPEVFARIHRHTLPGGRMTPEFAALLRRYLDQYHANGEIRDD